MLAAGGCPDPGGALIEPSPTTADLTKPAELTEEMLLGLRGCMASMKAGFLDPVQQRHALLKSAKAATSPTGMVQTFESHRASYMVLESHQIGPADYVRRRLTVAACMELVPQVRSWDEFRRAARDYRQQIPLQVRVAGKRLRLRLKGTGQVEGQPTEEWIKQMLTWRKAWMGLMADVLEQMPQANYELVARYQDPLTDL